MKIGVISDTHAPQMGKVPPLEVARVFEGLDLILHAGDIYTSECLDWLEQFAPVLGVEVYPAPVQGDPRVVEKRVIEVEGYSIGLIHDLQLRGVGADIKKGVLDWPRYLDLDLPLLTQEIFGQPVNVVVHGHTHYAMAEKHQGLLIVNPGSPTLPNMQRRLGDVAIIELTPDSSEAWIIDLRTLGVE